MDLRTLQSLVDSIPLYQIIAYLCSKLWLPVVVFAVIFLCEYFAGANQRRYFSRSFAIDFCHWVFYVGGIFTVLIYTPIFSPLERALFPLRYNLLAPLPLPIAYVLYFIYADFVSYWYHRWLHTNQFLWAFHSVHHSAQHLTSMTVIRLHVGEILGASIITIVFIVLPLGSVTGSVWPVVVLVWCSKLLEAVHHAELPWRFGPLSRVLVSPVFHAVHHSTEPAHHNKNYGINLSLWDYLFGTAVEVQHRPQHYGGVEAMGVSESFTGQVLVPFKHGFHALAAAWSTIGRTARLPGASR